MLIHNLDFHESELLTTYFTEIRKIKFHESYLTFIKFANQLQSDCYDIRNSNKIINKKDELRILKSLWKFGIRRCPFFSWKHVLNSSEETIIKPYSLTKSAIQVFPEEATSKLRWLNSDTMHIIWPNKSKDLMFLTEGK